MYDVQEQGGGVAQLQVFNLFQVIVAPMTKN